jgi:hypothetical protein
VSADDLSLRLVKFISANISSVEHILVLQLLRGEPARRWTTAELALSLRSGESSIALRMDHLYERGVLSRATDAGVGGHRYIPVSEEVETMVGLLLEAYRERPTRVIELIYAPPDSALKAFADAFRFRKK